LKQGKAAMTVINYGISSGALENSVPVIDNLIMQRGFQCVIEVSGGFSFYEHRRGDFSTVSRPYAGRRRSHR